MRPEQWCAKRVSEGKILASDRCGGNFGKGRCGRLCREARVQAGVMQGEKSKMGCVWP